MLLLVNFIYDMATMLPSSLESSCRESASMWRWSFAFLFMLFLFLLIFFVLLSLLFFITHPLASRTVSISSTLFVCIYFSIAHCCFFFRCGCYMDKVQQLLLVRGYTICTPHIVHCYWVVHVFCFEECDHDPNYCPKNNPDDNGDPDLLVMLHIIFAGCMCWCFEEVEVGTGFPS